MQLLILQALQSEHFDLGQNVTVGGHSEGSGITPTLASKLKDQGISEVRAVMLTSIGLGDVSGRSPGRFVGRFALEVFKIGINQLGAGRNPTIERSKVRTGFIETMRSVWATIGDLFRVIRRVQLPMLLVDLALGRTTYRTLQVAQIGSYNEYIRNRNGVELYLVIPSNDFISPLFTQFRAQMVGELQSMGVQNIDQLSI